MAFKDLSDLEDVLGPANDILAGRAQWACGCVALHVVLQGEQYWALAFACGNHEAHAYRTRGQSLHGEPAVFTLTPNAMYLLHQMIDYYEATGARTVGMDFIRERLTHLISGSISRDEAIARILRELVVRNLIIYRADTVELCKLAWDRAARDYRRLD